MGDHTKIEWTNTTWNPVRGCSRVSEGCRFCYAERDAYRFSGKGQPYEGLAIWQNGHPHWTGKIMFVEEHLLDPLRWKRPRRIFVNSMSDLFHENVTDEMRDKIFAVMALAPQHTFQVLTKRPERMLAYLSQGPFNGYTGGRSSSISSFLKTLQDANKIKDRYTPIGRFASGPLPNIWLGVSVEHQEAADARIQPLLHVSAAVRFLSCEPLLGPLDLSEGLRIAWQCSGCHRYFPGGLQETCPVCKKKHYWTGSHVFNPPSGQVGSGINWVITGGESGMHARPMHPDWARSLRDQCLRAKVPFFFKQWGEWIEFRQSGLVQLPSTAHICEVEQTTQPLQCKTITLVRTGKKSAGHVLDGQIYHQFPGAVHEAAV